MSGKKTNGTGNGRDPYNKDVIKFPTLAERDRIRKEKEKEEAQWRAEYKKKQKIQTGPLLNIGNIPLFARAFFVTVVAVHFLLFVVFDAGVRLQAFYSLGFVPGAFTGTYEGSWLNFISPLTYIFIHGSWMHMVFNALMGLALCTFFEREFGARATVVFFVICGLTGALAYFLLNPFITAPVIGASGSTSGLFAAVLVLLFRKKKLGQLGRKGPWPVLIFWAVLMVVMGFMGGPENVAWQAHLGGYLAGILLVNLMLKGKLRL